MLTINRIASGPRDADRVCVGSTEQDTATNTGSLLLWGSSAYPRMDRADVLRLGGTDTRSVLAVGAGLSAEMPSGRRIAYRQINSADGSVTLRDSVAF